MRPFSYRALGSFVINRETLVRRLSFAAYFIFVFLLFLFFLFPFDRIKTKLETEVHNRTPLELTIAHISPRFFNYFVLTDVVVSNKQGAILFESPVVRTSLSLLSLVRGGLGVTLNSRAYGGQLLVKVRQSGVQRSVMLDTEGLDIASYKLLKTAGFNLTGKVGGNFEMTGESGKGRIWVKNVSSRQLTLKGFPIPDLDFEKGWLDFDVKGDRLLVKKLELSGKDLTVRATGDLFMREQGTINMTIRLRPSERLAHEQNALFSLLKNRDPEGFYEIKLGGSISNPLPQF